MPVSPIEAVLLATVAIGCLAFLAYDLIINNKGPLD